MPSAIELEPVAQGISLWRSYDSSVKAELYSTALEMPSGTYLIDPIPLVVEAVAGLASRRAVAAIFVTNENHERAAADFADKFGVPVYMDGAVAATIQLRRVVPISEITLPDGLSAIAIEGAPVGEIAIHSEAEGGTIVIGDALINFDPYGFAVLPAKYCSNLKTMKRSLSRLLDYPFERILFAHGLPILTGARDRLEILLREQR